LNQNAAELKNILAKELEIYERLLLLAKDKTKLMVDRKLPELQESIEQEESYVQQLIELEPLRQEQVLAIVGEPTIKLDVLVEKLPNDSLKDDLISIGSKLRNVVEEIRIVNEGNQRLAEVGLEVAQHTIKLMTKAPKPVTYGPSGSNKNGLRGRSLFDHKV
jgi:flagellar biosynthesis/type III secretory pathway chaperone